MTSAAADLSVIVVAADSGPVLGDCVAYVLAIDAVDELLVLDNASGDDSVDGIEQAHADDARVRIIRNDRNLGFGAAMNVGARQARGANLLLLNPDCLLQAAHVRRLLQTLTQTPDAGLVGAVVCAPDGTPDPASRRRDPLLRRSFNTLTGRAQREPEDPARSGVTVPGPIPEAVTEVEAVSGAAMLMSRELFRQLGGFDEGYFLHCEDLDLCRRVRDAGRRVVLDGRVRVVHAKGTSSRHRPVFVSRHKHRGMWRWFRKFDPAARNPLLAAIVLAGIWGHFGMETLARLWRWR